MSGLDTSPEGLLRRNGIQYKKRGMEARMPCPFCGRKTCFDLNLATGLWRCKHAGCGEAGNLERLARELGLLADMNSASDEDPAENLRQFLEGGSPYTTDAEKWHAVLVRSPNGKPARDYLASRGLTPQLWVQAGLGWVPRKPGTGKPRTVHGTGLVTIPYWVDGSDGREPAMVKMRWIPPEPIKASGKRRYERIKGGQSVLYAPWGINTNQTVLLCGGEFDALAVCQALLSSGADPDDPAGICPVAAPDGEGSWSDLYSQQLEAAADIVIAMDSDEAGRAAADKIMTRLGRHRCRVATWPAGAKDGNEALMEGLDLFGLQAMIAEAKSPVSDGITSLAKSATRLAQRILSVEEPAGRPTGIAPLDELIGGLRQGEITLMSGWTGTGKSTLAYQIGNHWDTQLGLRVLICPIEGGEVFAALKIARQQLGGDPNQASEDGLVTAFKGMKNTWILQHTGAIKPDKWRETLLWAVTRMGIDLVIADHLHFMAARGRGEYEELDRLIMESQMVIQNSTAHLLLLAHVNKDKAQGDDYWPTLADVKGRSTATQDIANVLATYRPRMKDKEEQADQVEIAPGVYQAAVLSLKQRLESGNEGTAWLHFHKQAARFIPEGAFSTAGDEDETQEE